MPHYTPGYLAGWASFDKRVAHEYHSGLSTYEVAALLDCSQGKIARSLRRTKTTRRTYRQANLLRAAA